MNPTLILTCRSCGGAVELVNCGQPIGLGSQLSAVVACTACRSEWHIRMTMMPLEDYAWTPSGTGVKRPRRSWAVCGTDGGYYRHRRVMEAACQPCRDAHAADERRRKPRGVRGNVA